VRRQCDCLRCYIFLLRFAHNVGLVWWDCEYRRNRFGDDDSRLTKKAEPRRNGDAAREGGTESANRRWLRRLVRPLSHILSLFLSNRSNR
jgi:hypothetical protein